MAEKSSSNNNMSRVVSVETAADAPDGKKMLTMVAPRREVEIHEEEATTPTLRVIQSPMDALRIGMVSPFRNFLGLLKPPPLPTTTSLSDHPAAAAAESSPRASIDWSSTLTLSSGGKRREGQNVVMVAFDANVKEVSHSGIVWAMEHVLQRGDMLAILSVLDSVRGPLGYRVKIGDYANHKLIEEEVQQKMEAWRSFPGLERRCEEGGVTLLVIVKGAQRSELAVVKEAVTLGACHVVLDKSMKNRHRAFYLHNLACNVTRMRRSGGVDVIRPSLDTVVSRNEKLLLEPRSPTSVILPPLLSYGDQIDEFEISLRAPKPKRLPSKSPSPKELLSSPKELFRHVPSAAILEDRPSSVSTPSLRDSMTSSSNAEDDMDDDLFSIFHGSTRHDTDAAAFSNLNNSGYESDELFSIGNASTRRVSPLHSHHHSMSDAMILPRSGELVASPLHSHHHSMSDAMILPRSGELVASPLHSHHHSMTDAMILPPSGELVVTEPLRQATISRITFVVGLSDAVTLTLRSPLRAGEGLLVGSSPSALFLMHAGDHQSATVTLSTATPSSYIAMEGQMAMKLSFLEPEQRVLAVDSLGRCRTIRVENAGAHKKPLVLVEAQCDGRRHGVLLHHTDTVGLRHSSQSSQSHWGGHGVKGLKVGDRVLLRLRSAEPSHAIWS